MDDRTKEKSIKTGALFGLPMMDAANEIVDQLAGVNYGPALQILELASEILMTRVNQEPVRTMPRPERIRMVEV